MARFDDYATKYQTVRMERRDGILCTPGDGGRKEQGAGGAENGGSGNWAFMRPML
jgi:hypothetical protein